MIGSMALPGIGLGVVTPFAAAPMVIPGTPMAKELQSVMHTITPASNPGQESSYCLQLLADINGIRTDPNSDNGVKAYDRETVLQYWTIRSREHGSEGVLTTEQVERVSKASTIEPVEFQEALSYSEDIVGIGIAGAFLSMLLVVPSASGLFPTEKSAKIAFGSMIAIVVISLLAACGAGAWGTIEEGKFSRVVEVYPPLSAEICDIEPSISPTK